MLLGVIADDFTGATDVANTLTREGMRTRLLIGKGGGDDDCDAAVIALKSRSIPAAEAVAESLDALRRLQRAGCRQLMFKYCSTFDSTPQGNIGPVAEALAAALDATGVVVCPAFPQAGRTIYQGHLFVGDKLLSESGMERHPLTPMTDPDLRRWLARQTRGPVDHCPLAIVRAGAQAVRERLAQSGAPLVVVDAVSDADLHMIGGAVADHALVTGGSGIALGLPGNFRAAGMLRVTPSVFAPQEGPGIVLSGSCSQATRGQIAAYQSLGRPSLELDIDGLMRGAPVLDDAMRFIDAQIGGSPLIYSSADGAALAALQRQHGVSESAAAVERAFGALARHAVGQGYRRIVAAGGETSGAVTTALGVTALDVGPEIAPGVPAVSSRADGGLALALKSGNFGGSDFLAEALRMLGGGNA